jgi:hypothetical protein
MEYILSANLDAVDVARLQRGIPAADRLAQPCVDLCILDVGTDDAPSLDAAQLLKIKSSGPAKLAVKSVRWAQYPDGVVTVLCLDGARAKAAALSAISDLEWTDAIGKTQTFCVAIARGDHSSSVPALAAVTLCDVHLVPQRIPNLPCTELKERVLQGEVSLTRAKAATAPMLAKRDARVAALTKECDDAIACAARFMRDGLRAECARVSQSVLGLEDAMRVQKDAEDCLAAAEAAEAEEFENNLQQHREMERILMLYRIKECGRTIAFLASSGLSVELLAQFEHSMPDARPLVVTRSVLRVPMSAECGHHSGDCHEDEPEVSDWDEPSDSVEWGHDKDLVEEEAIERWPSLDKTEVYDKDGMLTKCASVDLPIVLISQSTKKRVRDGADTDGMPPATRARE